MSSRLADVIIIRDTREKENNGWVFEQEEKKPGKVRILGTEESTLDAADYSIKGLEHIIRIERKASLSELFGNYSPVDHRERFEREMEKMRDIPHKYLLIESSLSLDSFLLSIPQFRHSLPGKRVIEWLDKLEQEYNIRVKFVGECGKKYAKLIFSNIARKYL